jgi:acetyl-CoA C-acetyltransferase
MAGALREHPDWLGVVTTVSGLLTKPGLAVWSATPDGQPPLLGDRVEEATRVTGSIDGVASLEEYAGPATVVTYTVTPDGPRGVGAPEVDGWSRTVVVGDTDDGRRCVAVSQDPAVAGEAVSGELIGRTVAVKGGTFTV